ncbi:uncharacterized protein CXorf51A-like [Equus asinus]|uniref:Spermatid nuclear transition protein 4 n=1 Tax=Equus asinus TaxID=9793 RepID=A0A9L0IZC8_EQUAS|nr:uncharacterized protein CXorf51A-like [Equus asinus]
MAKITWKPQEPNRDVDQPTSSSKGKQKMKSPHQPGSRGGGKVLKTTLKIKRPLQRSSSKKVSEKTTKFIRKPKKAKGTMLFGHYHRLNKKMNQNEPEQDPESLEKSTTSSDDLGSQ